MLSIIGTARATLVRGRSRGLSSWFVRVTLVLDSEGRVITSAATLVKVIRPRSNCPSFEWVISRVSVAPVTAEIARHAGVLLEHAGRHGHKYAMLAATALLTPGPGDDSDLGPR